MRFIQPPTVIGLAIFLSLIPAAQAQAQTSPDFGVSTANEKDDRSPIDAYKAGAFFGHTMCELSFRLSRTLSDNPSASPENLAKADYRRCISLHQDAIKKLAAKATKSLKSPSAKAALKEHLVATLVALTGIAPQQGEIVLDYERRTNAEKRAVEQQLIRLDAEL